MKGLGRSLARKFKFVFAAAAAVLLDLLALVSSLT